MVRVLSFAALVPCALSTSGIDTAFTQWVAENGKVYETDEEMAYRKGVFAEAYAKSVEFASSNPHAHIAPGPWADWTREEFRALYGKPKPSGDRISLPRFVPSPTLSVNETIDWEQIGAVTSVKDQGQYGTCWSFATSGTMEGQQFVVSGRKPVDLAPQMMIDCCSECYGHPDKSLHWLLQVGGQDTLESYGPYHGDKGRCNKDAAVVGEEIIAVKEVEHEEDFMAALQSGPMHIAIDDASLQSYRGGVMTNTICEDPGNHDVLLVGAGEENGVKYWRVKNSWGTRFGESGFFRVVRGKGALCLGKPNSFGSAATTATGKPDSVAV